MDRWIGIAYGPELSLPAPASVFRAQAGPCLVCRRISELLVQGESEVLCTIGCRLSDDDWSRAATDGLDIQDIQCGAVRTVLSGRWCTLRRLQWAGVLVLCVLLQYCAIYRTTFYTVEHVYQVLQKQVHPNRPTE